MSDSNIWDKPEVQDAWNYPLFDAIMQRRSRRFGLGMEIKHGPNKYKSDKEPVPLSELEEALLIQAGTGLSGSNLADMPHSKKEEMPDREWDGCCNTMMDYQGRTWSSPCGSHGTELFYTNDDGVFLFNTRNMEPDKMQEFQTSEDKNTILDIVRKHRVKLQDGRLDLPRQIPVYFSFNMWNANQPGTTVFMPVSDVTAETINAIMLLIEQGTYLIDDRFNYTPCGCEKWVKGTLKTALPLPLTAAEGALASVIGATESAFIGHNIQLAMQAMGLGGWLYGGFTPQIVMGGTPFATGLGFRHVTGEMKAGASMPTAVGIDGIFEGYCPPYYKNMDEAVDAVVADKFGPKGIFNTEAGRFSPYKNREEIEKGIPKTEEEVIEITKAICNYIYKTYGRFPATVPAMNMILWVQAHHLDLDFYDRFYKEGAYSETQRKHMEKWHSKKEAASKAA